MRMVPSPSGWPFEWLPVPKSARPLLTLVVRTHTLAHVSVPEEPPPSAEPLTEFTRVVVITTLSTRGLANDSSTCLWFAARLGLPPVEQWLIVRVSSTVVPRRNWIVI